jgi:hypothetical protein
MLRKLAVLLGASALAAISVAQNYALRSTGIRAGVLLIESQRQAGIPANPTPHVFYNLDSNLLVKPAGWNIHNPRSSTQVTTGIAARWLTLDPAGAPAVNDPITKRNAAYWEVPLSLVSDDEITSYDILLLSARGTVSLTSGEREKLRRFVDQGGILWVDFNSASNLDPINGAPLPFGKNTANVGSAGANLQHPLLKFPNAISENGLSVMASDVGAGIDFTTVPPALMPILGATEADSTRLTPVAASVKGPIISVGKLGDGFVVVTSQGVATTLNRLPSGGGYVANNGYRAGAPSFDRSGNAAAGLVINMLHLNAGHSSFSGSTHKTNSTPVDLWAPLLKRFQVDVALPSGPKIYQPMASYKGIVYVSLGDGRIAAFDANPSSDLDGDGNPDDGYTDFLGGTNYDLLWITEVAGPTISSATVVEVPNAASGIPRDQLLVTTERGVVCFDALQLDAQGRIRTTGAAPVAYRVDAPQGAANFAPASDAPGPYAPTIHEGLGYVADIEDQGLNKVGRVWVFDPATGNRVSSTLDWAVGGRSGLYGTLPEISGPLTVGYIPVADNSGALDKVVYLPTRNVPGSLSPNGSAGVVSLWAGVKGETIKDRDVNVVPGQMTINTRASLQGLNVNISPFSSTTGIKLSVVDGTTGNPWDATTMGQAFTGTVLQSSPGILNFGITPIGQTLLNANPRPRVMIDYSIDWGVQVLGPVNAVVRGQFNLPDDAGKNRRILHNLALSPKGTLYLTHGDGSTGGSLYAFREEGRGQFKLLYRYELYNEHRINLNQAAAVTYRETLSDTDPLTQFMPGLLGGRIGNISFQSGPTIRNDTVYVTARGFKSGIVPVTIVLAFRAEPETVQVRVGELPANFSIVQPDLARSANKAVPEAFSTLQPGQYVYERDPGSDSGTIRIENMSSSTRGPMLQTISTSQPIIIRRSGQPDLLLDPGNTSTRWSPLLWYMVLHGVSNDSPPLVTGETLFVVGSSMLPHILEFGSLGPPRGIIMGLDATISANDPFLAGDALRPWQKQLYQLTTTPSFRSNPDIRWPQGAGVTSFEDWRVRLLQTAMDPGPALGVTGGEGAVFVWQPAKLWSFSRADFLIADEGRLVRLDPSGNGLWASDKSLTTGPADVGSAGSVKPLVRPTRAYPLSTSEMIVVDTGGDRIVRMDTTGREIRSINNFKLDPVLTPAGYQANETTSFRQPRDVSVYTTWEQNPANVTNPRPLEYWVHYVIADSGNRRLIELVDRYEADPATRRIVGIVDMGGNAGAALGVLNWHSPAEYSGKNFLYTSIARIWNPVSARFVFAAGIGNAMPTRVDVGLDAPGVGRPREASGNGGILIIDGQNSTIINEVTVPSIAANLFWNENTGTFNSPVRPARTLLLGDVNSVTMRMVDVGGTPMLGIMYTDDSGAYEVVGSGSNWTVRWMLTDEVYRVMRRSGYPAGQPWLGTPTGANPQHLRAAYARRLDSGEVIVVNSYQGFLRNGANFAGEVIQVDGDVDFANSNDNTSTAFSFNKINLGFRSSSVVFEVPPVQNTRGLVIPIFADRR